jgi:hypothetical protein
MPSTQFGGPIGPFLDRVQQRGVPVNVSGSVDFMTNGPVTDPVGLENHVRNQLLLAIRNVLGQQMATGQLTFRNLGEGTLGGADIEIVNATGLQQQGIQIGNLAMRFAIDNGPPQQEVRAHVHVGGVNIKMSSTGGVDTKHLGNQLIAKAKSAVLWYVLFGVLTLAIVGGTIWYLKRTVKKALDQPSATAAVAAKWDGKSALACGGNDEITVSGVTAKLTGTAVTAGGNCKLTLDKVDITAPTGIEAGGNAIVTVTGGSITSTDLAAQALGNAKITFTGTKVSGKTKALGGAKITGP